MNDKQEQYTLRKRLGELLRSVGSLRDGFLVTAAILYFFGYIVWAINAYRNDLGLLPALEFQYFIAGAPPVLIILALCLIVVASKRLIKQVRDWLGPKPTGNKLYLCWVMFGLQIAALVSIMVLPHWSRAKAPNDQHGSWIVLISAIIIVVSYPFASQVAPRKIARKTLLKSVRDVFLGLATLYLRLLAILFAVAFLIGLAALGFIYCVELYPTIPQEFGGARPYHACLDLVKTQMSNETIAGVLPIDAIKSNAPIAIDAIKSNAPVVRSLRVEVLFSGSEMMLVRSQGKVFKIARSTIQTVATCDEGESKVLRVARPTDNVPEVLNFYRDGLGLEVLSSFSDHNDFDGVILGRKNSRYHLEFTHKRGHKAGKAPSQDNLLVFYMPDEAEWKGAIERMQKHGYEPVKPFNSYWDDGGKTFEDIDGYRVVLYNERWDK